MTMLGGAFVGGVRRPGYRSAVQKSLNRHAARQVRIAKASARMARAAGGSAPAPVAAGRSLISFYGALTEPFNASRSIITSWDASAVLRQGGILSLANPKSVPGALADMFRALASSGAAVRDAENIHKRPNAAMYRHAGLFLSEGPGGSLTAREENFASRIAGAVPGVKRSERMYGAFLNRLRADVFDTLSGSLMDSGTPPTTRELKAIANYVNVATGRGELGAASKFANELSTVFFAPRLVSSRFEFLAGQPFYAGTARTRGLVGEQYARYLLGLAVVYQLGKMAGGETDFDPTSSDFGKIRFDDTRVDVLSGLGQSAVVSSRLLSGTFTSASGKSHSLYRDVPEGKAGAGGVALRFARTKLSPVYGTAVNLWAGENAVGDPVTAGSAAADLAVPIILGDTYEILMAHGLPEFTAFSLVNMLGAGVAVYGRKTGGKAAREFMIAAAKKRKAYNDANFGGLTRGEQDKAWRESLAPHLTGGGGSGEFLKGLGAVKKKSRRVRPAARRADNDKAG